MFVHFRAVYMNMKCLPLHFPKCMQAVRECNKDETKPLCKSSKRKTTDASAKRTVTIPATSLFFFTNPNSNQKLEF